MRKTRMFLAVAALIAVSLAATAADVNGAWSGTFHTREGGAFEVTLNLKAQGDKLTGTLGQGSQEDVDIENGKVNGDTVTFAVTRHFQQQSRKINYTGKVDGNNMKLTFQLEGSDRANTIDMTKK